MNISSIEGTNKKISKTTSLSNPGHGEKHSPTKFELSRNLFSSPFGIGILVPSVEANSPSRFDI